MPITTKPSTATCVTLGRPGNTTSTTTKVPVSSVADRLETVGNVDVGTGLVGNDVLVYDKPYKRWVPKQYYSKDALDLLFAPFSMDIVLSTWELIDTFYVIQIPATTHKKGTQPIIQAIEILGTESFVVIPEVSKYDLSGNVTIAVPASPDFRFVGKILIK